MVRSLKLSVLALCAIVAFGTVAGTPASASARHGFSASSRHQFQYAQIPTSVQNRYRVGLWTFNPGTGKLRLCVLGGGKGEPGRIMTCSAWVGESPPGTYRLMQIRINRNNVSDFKAGLWIINYRTGDTRACVITDIDDPTGSLKCSKSQ
jgi:hypothetical protein